MVGGRWDLRRLRRGVGSALLASLVASCDVDGYCQQIEQRRGGDDCFYFRRTVDLPAIPARPVMPRAGELGPPAWIYPANFGPW